MKGISLFFVTIVLVASLAPLHWAKNALRQSHAHAASQLEAQLEEPLYLPDAKYIRLVTLGFDNFISDILWFQTVNYFGKQYLGGKDYRWLDSMCTLVTTLNPNAMHVYDFCGTLLAWMAKDAEASNRILTRGIENHPSHWRFHYLRGFNKWYFLSDKASASEDMRVAAKLPGAPPFITSLASKLLADAGDPRNAVAFLTDALRATKDPAARKALEEKLVEARVALDVKILDNAVKDARAVTGREISSLKQLVELGKLRYIPKDPFGKEYVLNAQSGLVTTQDGSRGLQFTGKTAETGLLSNEFRKIK